MPKKPYKEIKVGDYVDITVRVQVYEINKDGYVLRTPSIPYHMHVGKDEKLTKSRIQD